MVLIDSLYVNNSGGKVLLDYLVESLEISNGENFFYLFDIRCKGQYKEIPNYRKLYLNPTLKNRLIFYLKNIKKFDKIFCFGNIPPPISTRSFVYTYFHNINLVSIPKEANFFIKINIWFKRSYISILKSHTDYWLVQTTNTKNTLINFYKEEDNKFIIVPFFNLTPIKPATNKTDYVYISNYTNEKNHERLIIAWNKIFEMGFTLKLHLTLSEIPKKLERLLQNSISKGVTIINHGSINKFEIEKILSVSKATIYPSVNESLGLGIIEALFANCDVIGADLDYIHSICKPSVVFNPYEIDSLVEAIIKYETNNSDKSILLIENKIEVLQKILN